MKKTIIISIIIFTFSIIIFSGCTNEESKVGVLDMEKVIAESRRARQLNDELEDIGIDLEEDYREREETIEEEDAENEEELDRIYEQFLENKENLEGELNQEINEILDEITEEENLDVVVLAQYTQYGGQDITETTIEKLDEEYYEE